MVGLGVGGWVRNGGGNWESLCATTVDGVVRVCVSTHSFASLCVDLVKAFQKTWPCCRNGHRF